MHIQNALGRVEWTVDNLKPGGQFGLCEPPPLAAIYWFSCHYKKKRLFFLSFHFLIKVSGDASHVTLGQESLYGHHATTFAHESSHLFVSG
jgi:hypothetical protein